MRFSPTNTDDKLRDHAESSGGKTILRVRRGGKKSKSEAHTAIFDYLECSYNRRRLHSALGYQSPQNFLTRYFQNQQPQLN